MNDSVMLDGPKSLYLPPQAIAIVLDNLANGQFKVVNPVITLIMQQLREQEPKKEVNREESNPAPTAGPVDGMSGTGPADR